MNLIEPNEAHDLLDDIINKINNTNDEKDSYLVYLFDLFDIANDEDVEFKRWILSTNIEIEQYYCFTFKYPRNNLINPYCEFIITESEIDFNTFEYISFDFRVIDFIDFAYIKTDYELNGSYKYKLYKNDINQYLTSSDMQDEMMRFEIALNNLTNDMLYKIKRKSIMESRLNKLKRIKQ